MGIKVKYVDNEEELNICFSIRRKVFIEEQNIPEAIEMDDISVNAKSICAILDGDYVGTARYRETPYGTKLERFAVLKEHRFCGVGKALVNFIFNNFHKHKNIYLHAQEPVVDFYNSLGFKKVEDKFHEAGIPHWKMIKDEQKENKF